MSITPEKKREQCISNALYMHTLERHNWFIDIDDKIFQDISNSPQHRDRTILKWLKSCETVRGEVVKQEILRRYNAKKVK